jgi:hypothetical protein
MSESDGTLGTLRTFKAAADNPLTRNVLKALSKQCRKDGANRLEVALELYVGTRKTHVYHAEPHEACCLQS